MSHDHSEPLNGLFCDHPIRSPDSPDPKFPAESRQEAALLGVRLQSERLEIIEVVRQFIVGDPRGGGAESTLAFLDGIEFMETGVDRRSAREAKESR
jgi:hypothetical protein